MRFLIILFLFISSHCYSQERTDSVAYFTIGVNFPGLGFTEWKMQSDNFHYYKNDNNHGLTSDYFNGFGLNIFYNLELLFSYKRIRIGAVVGQEYFHIDKFNNHKLNFPLIPLFTFNEQTHFHKFLGELEFKFLKKKKKAAFNIQAGWLLPERIFYRENVITAFTINGGPLFSMPVSERTDLFVKIYFDYKRFVHLAMQSCFSLP